MSQCKDTNSNIQEAQVPQRYRATRYVTNVSKIRAMFHELCEL